jgi:pimeloyl-ACP methyl ester carboxylesterase
MPRIVYLHGFASGPASQKASFFRARIPQLEVPDLAGGDFENLTITGQLKVIENLAAGDPVALIGSSLGGYLAALYAARHPEVTRLVLLAPALGFARRWAQSINVEEWRCNGFIEVYHYGEKRQRKLGYQLLEDAAAYEDSPSFPQPALLFHGTRDSVVPSQGSEQFAASHPNVRLRPLDSGHELVDVLDTIWQETAPFLII